MHRCVLYNRECKIKQCFNCYQYGHILPQCRAKTVCGSCSGPHKSSECLETEKQCCPVCKGKHKAWDIGCEKIGKKNWDGFERLASSYPPIIKYTDHYLQLKQDKARPMRKVTKRWKQSLLILKKSCPPPAKQQNNVKDQTQHLEEVAEANELLRNRKHHLGAKPQEEEPNLLPHLLGKRTNHHTTLSLGQLWQKPVSSCHNKLFSSLTFGKMLR